jgi:hypothetical protein
MRISLSVIPFAVLLALCAAGPAAARNGTTAPSGNSAINQYVEMIPTASGGRPTNKVHGRGGASHSTSPPNGGSQGTGGGGSGGGGGPAGGSPAGGGPISSSTARALDGQGPAGVAAANLALATGHGSAGGSRGQHGTGAVASAPSFTGGGTRSAATSLLDALTGSSSGGLGLLLPALLIAILVGAAARVLLRRRRGPSGLTDS